MIWKIFFVLFALLFLFLQIGGITSTFVLSEVNIAAGYILMLAFVFIAAYFFSLGWKKKLFSLKANTINFAFLVLFILLIMASAVIAGMPVMMAYFKYNLVGDISDNAIYSSSLMLLILCSIALYSILFSPVICAYFKYKKHFPVMSDVDKPYWKIFLTYFAVTSVINNFYYLIFADKTGYNAWDYIWMAACLIEVFYAIGYAYNIKFGKQLIWKIAFVPYAIYVFAHLFLCSEEFLNASGEYIVKISYVSFAATLIISLLTLFAFYKYAFTHDVYKIAENSAE